jgi:alpha,alpha-trehalase
MTNTAQNTVRNMIDFVTRYGFVPNGGREYYTQRSQPPFLTLMVAAVAHVDPFRDGKAGVRTTSCHLPEEAVDISFLTETYQALDTEYTWWMTTHSVSLTRPENGQVDTLNR